MKGDSGYVGGVSAWVPLELALHCEALSLEECNKLHNTRRKGSRSPNNTAHTLAHGLLSNGLLTYAIRGDNG